MDPTDASLADLARAVARKELSPVEITDAVLARIDRLDPSLNAFITVEHDRARRAARDAEDEVMAHGPRGPLHGIPVAHKDIIATKGVRTTGHSALLTDHRPNHDATVVVRWEEAGAIRIGKLNTYEFACGATEHFGVPVNPWNVERTTGGSSSGAAAGVAARFIHGATGTDTGGSIRGPASYCGAVGLKPTYGRVSRYGVMPLSWSLDHVGPLARTAVDAALLLDGMVGADPRDPTCRPAPDERFGDAVGFGSGSTEPTVRGLRLGVPYDWLKPPVEPEVAKAVKVAIEDLEAAGATIVPITLPAAEHSLTATFGVLSAEATLAHLPRLRVRATDYAAFTRHSVLLGASVDGIRYLQAQQVRTRLLHEVEDALAEVDAMVWPTTRRTAPPVDEAEVWTVVQTQLTNLTGHPSATVPCGFTSEGLPVGMLITGRWFDEATVLRIAAAYQQLRDWHTQVPDVPEAYRPPESKPYALGSLPEALDATQRAALCDRVRAGLRRWDVPEVDGDVEAVAGSLHGLEAGLDAANEVVGEGVEPFQRSSRRSG